MKPGGFEVMAPVSTAAGRNLRPILSMLFAVAMFAAMDTGLKILAASLPAIEVATLRALSSLPLIILYAAVRGRLALLKAHHWPLHLLRGLLGVLMLACFALALRSLSLANAYALFFVAPLLITALAAWFLKEQVDARRWLAILFGFIGVLVILRPTGDGMLSLAGLMVLLAATAYAVSAITVRVIAKHDSIEAMMFWLCLLIAVIGGAIAWPNWVPVTGIHFWPLVMIGITGTLGQFAITYAFHQGEASLIAPFEYTALIWGILIDWTLWAVLPDGVTLLGAGFLIASGIYLVRHERRHAEDPSAHP